MKSRGMAAFLAVWAGQVVSALGTGLSGFALGVWVYQRTGSATRFALITLVTTLPGMLLTPIAGALVDRWDRRRAMILSNVGAGFTTLILALLFWYVVNALYYLTYRPSPASRMATTVGRPAARTLLFPRSWFFLSSSPATQNMGDALELADLPLSFNWVRMLFQVPGYRWAPAGDLYECHY